MIKKVLFIAVLAGMVNVHTPQKAHAMRALPWIAEKVFVCKNLTRVALCGVCVLTCMSLTSWTFQEVDELSLSKRGVDVIEPCTGRYCPVSHDEALKIDVNYRGPVDLKTPLHRAVENGDLNAVLSLIFRHADLDTQDIEGNTPLHIAIKNGHQIIIKFLRCCDARIDIKNKEGQTALEMAEEMGYENIGALFSPLVCKCG